MAPQYLAQGHLAPVLAFSSENRSPWITNKIFLFIPWLAEYKVEGPLQCWRE